MKKPTLKQKVAQYEAFLHKINMACICMDNLAIQELVQNADAWSYAHRQGNGELSDKEQQDLINAKFMKLLDTPKADKAREEMRQKRTKALDALTKQGQELKMGYEL
jgi:hypothetical protein